MLGSLGIGHEGRHCPPPRGSRSPFLSAGPGAPALGGGDLALLSRIANAGPSYRLVLPARGPLEAPVLRPLPGAAPAAAFSISHISEGRFTERTIENMHRAVLQAKTDAQWRALMENIRQEGRRRGAIGWKDYLGEARWFDHYYRSLHAIDYVRDPAQVELVMHPWYTYLKGLGDCDDSSTLWAASLGAIGAPHAFTTYRADPRRPHDWSHVAAKAWVPGHGWVNNDLTIRGAPLGFEPRGFVTRHWPEPRL
jgi:hypothetical protein